MNRIRNKLWRNRREFSRSNLNSIRRPETTPAPPAGIASRRKRALRLSSAGRTIRSAARAAIQSNARKIFRSWRNLLISGGRASATIISTNNLPIIISREPSPAAKDFFSRNITSGRCMKKTGNVLKSEWRLHISIRIFRLPELSKNFVLRR